MCEEFACVPSAAERELDQHRELVLEILALRAYARAKQAYDDADRLDEKSRRRLMQDALVQAVKETEFALVQAAIAARQGSTEDDGESSDR